MTVALTTAEAAIANGSEGEALRVAMRIVVDTGRLLGARRLLPITSAHIDGGLYHGDSGTEFAEFLAHNGAQVRVPATMNVGALDLTSAPGGGEHHQLVQLDDHPRRMARRLMRAYEDIGCLPSWTCAPYQAGHRPALGEQVAWGESNAVVFCNSVLGARTNRYGDYLDIACALVARAPEYGLHIAANRRARVVVNTDAVPASVKAQEVFWPVLGAWLGSQVGSTVAAIDGLAEFATEDRLKALGAAAAAFGEVALFHVVGYTPEAPDLASIVQDTAGTETLQLDSAQLRAARRRLSTVDGAMDAIVHGAPVTAIAIGSPHLSIDEFETVLTLLEGRRLKLPFYANTGRHVLRELEQRERMVEVRAAGITLVIDTCVVVTPILDAAGGVLLTNSGKFACYAPGNTGYQTLYGSLAECVESAVAGHFVPAAGETW